MPDHRQHRGRHPEDDRLFAADQWPLLRSAVGDLSWLLSRDYSLVSALKLVGDRYQLAQRQRIAVARASCSDQARASRREREVTAAAISQRALAIDGLNALTTLEAALSGGVLLSCRDGCLRDMASVHGTYRQVVETLPALELVADCLAHWNPVNCRWYLDAPVSNTRRLARLIDRAGAERGLTWQTELVNSPDRELACETAIVATADSAILDQCGHWFNLTRQVIADKHIAVSPIDLT